MASYVSSAEGRVIVVTNVEPVTDPAAAGQPQQYVGIQRFIKCWPQALGTVQIIVGVMMLLFGIAMSASVLLIRTVIGLLVWGAALHITAGSLTVAAGKRPTRSLVNCALALSIVAAVFSAVGFITYIMAAVGCYPSSNSGCSLTKGVSGVLAVFNLLEMIVAIVVAGYGCYSTCGNSGAPTVVILPEGALATGESVALSNPQMQNIKGAEEAASMPQPPPYSTQLSADHATLATP